MTSCRNGHTSVAPDFCDVCGARMGGAPPAPAAGGAPGAGTGAGRACPDCGTPGTDRFCEACGYDFATGGGQPTPRTTRAAPGVLAPGPPGPPPAWVAVVTADRGYFDTVIAEEGPDSASLSFPPYAPERRIPLTGAQVRIGRRGAGRPAPPEIDLREPPEDPGVSHLHAVLLAKPDGTWTLVDPGSTNRTSVNGSPEPIPFNVEVPLGDGDRVHVGAWTTITLFRGDAT